MARDNSPIVKQSRREGYALHPKAHKILAKKSGIPGQHAHGRQNKPSLYATQLREKQKAKFIYGVLEKPFRNNFARAKKLKYGTTGENLMILLELRLDNVIFRLGLARTRKEARQMVGHKMVLVNGKQVNIPSYTVAVGDKIEIKEKKKSIQRIKDVLEATNGRLVPAWLEMDRENLTATVKEIPTRDQIDVPVDEVFIVELYSK